MKEYLVPAIIEQHIHGGFGVNFNNCTVDDVTYFLNEIKNYAVKMVYPTLHTDTPENLNKQIKVIYDASKKQNDVKVMGVHLEGPFINPLKKGVHDENLIIKPDIKTYKKIVEDVDEEFIKIVTLAPELDDNYELTNYLKSKDVVVSAGHCCANDLSKVNQVTHLFNAMGGISHKKNMTALEALMNNEIYTEIIADGNHVIDNLMKLVFKVKPLNKIILISDALPIAHSKNKSEIFMGQEIFLHGDCAKTKDGTLAGCAVFVFEIIKKLVDKGLLDIETAFNMASKNVSENLKIGHGTMLKIDENFKILDL